MPEIKPISYLRTNANEVSDFCRKTREPLFITRNGSGDMVILNIHEYEKLQGMLDLFQKLDAAEREIREGDKGEDFDAVAEEMRAYVHGKL